MCTYLSLLPPDILFVYISSPTSFLSSLAVQIGFSPTTYEVEEDAGIVVLFVENRNPDLEREVTVQFTTTEGSAVGKG